LITVISRNCPLAVTVTLTGGARGVPQSIRQALLDDAEGGQARRRRQFDGLGRQVEVDARPRPPGDVDERRNVVDGRLRGQIGITAAAEDREQAAHLGQRLPGRCGHRFELAEAALIESGQPVLRRRRLHADDRHAVGDDIMEFLGDAVALLEFVSFGQLRRAEFAFGGQLPATADEQSAGDADDAGAGCERDRGDDIGQCP
jgi:hypothetical protein